MNAASSKNNLNSDIVHESIRGGTDALQDTLLGEFLWVLMGYLKANSRFFFSFFPNYHRFEVCYSIIFPTDRRIEATDQRKNECDFGIEEKQNHKFFRMHFDHFNQVKWYHGNRH